MNNENRKKGKKKMNANEYRIEWSLDWSENEAYPACYHVSEHQQRERRKLNDGTSDVLDFLYLHHKTGNGWYLSFGIDYIPNHQRLTKWHESVSDCWREMLTLGVSEATMRIIEYDIYEEDTYEDYAPIMLEYFRKLCSAQSENPDEPKI